MREGEKLKKFLILMCVLSMSLIGCSKNLETYNGNVEVTSKVTLYSKAEGGRSIAITNPYYASIELNGAKITAAISYDLEEGLKPGESTECTVVLANPPKFNEGNKFKIIESGREIGEGKIIDEIKRTPSVE